MRLSARSAPKPAKAPIPCPTRDGAFMNTLQRLGGRFFVFALAAILASAAFAASERSSTQRAAFVRANPCPATGQPRGKCPGWVVDHIVPLCAGGADHPDNMQWQTTADAKTKDRDERKQCRVLKPLPAVGGFTGD